MTAGRRDTLVAFQNATTVVDEAGGETPTWSTLATEWAAVFYGRGDERRAAAQEKGQQSATFQVLANEHTRSVGVKDRLTMNPGDDEPDYWDIVGVAPMGRANIEFTAVRAL